MPHCRSKSKSGKNLSFWARRIRAKFSAKKVLPRLTISRKSLAVQLGISYSGVSRLLRERRRITGGLAARLAAISGTSALYWLVLQAHHDAWVLLRTQ